MRYVTFSIEDEPVPRLGVAYGDPVVELRSVAVGSATLPATLLELIRGGEAAWRQVSELLSGSSSRLVDIGIPMRDIRWHAPIPRPPKNVFCVGRNYVGHEAARARGAKVKLPEVPIFFTKAPPA